MLLFPFQKAVDGRKLVVVLDPKRSNAINIGLTVLPPIHVIKTAILSFDEFAINKEGIEVRRDFLGYLWMVVLSASESFLCKRTSGDSDRSKGSFH